MNSPASDAVAGFKPATKRRTPRAFEPVVSTKWVERFEELDPRDPEPRFVFNGITFTDVETGSTPGLVARWARQVAESGEGRHVHLVNVYTLALADKDPELKALLQRPDAVNLLDSTPLVWLARRRGLVPTSRMATRGPGMFLDSLAGSAHQRIRHFLLGGTPQTLSALSHQIQIQTGALQVGSYSPSFDGLPEQDYRQAETLDSASPDVVWVGLGTPKQDVEAARLAAQGRLAIAVGAAFDFLAGTRPEAPKSLRGSGFEWVFRLVTEPRRLWRRYLLDCLPALLRYARS